MQFLGKTPRVALAAVIITIGGILSLLVAGVKFGDIVGGPKGATALIVITLAVAGLAFAIWRIGKENWAGREGQLAGVVTLAVAVVFGGMIASMSLKWVHEAVAAIKPQFAGLIFIAASVIVLVTLAFTATPPTKRRR